MIHGSAQVVRGPDAAAPAQPRRRVLILRSARGPQVERAIAVARERNPGAEVVALSHRGHADALQSWGIERVVEVAGRRFDLSRTAPWTLARLRATAYEEIVLPQMSSAVAAHLNLHRLVAALRCERVVLVADGDEPRVFSRSDFRHNLLLDTLSVAGPLWDVIALLFLLIAARLRWSRPRPIPPATRPRVLHVIGALALGGAQRQLVELVNATPPERYDVEIVVLFKSGGDFARQWLKRQDVKITALERWPHYPLLVFELWRYCRRTRVDVMHTWLFMPNAVGACAARLAGVRHVVASVRSLNPGHLTWHHEWWKRPVDILGLHAADTVTVNATALAIDHARWALMRRSKFAVIHNGLDPSRFLIDRADARHRLATVVGTEADAIFIGTNGRLAREKDHRLFLELIDTARRTHPRVHGVVIGDGELRGEVEQLAASMGLGSAVTFLGIQPDAPRLVAGLDVFVLPSLVEGFPNALLEAVLSGIPAIASRVGGNTDILEDPVSTFPAGDLDAAAAALLPLLADRGRAAARAARTRRRALEAFTTRRMADAWFAVYDRGLAGATTS